MAIQDESVPTGYCAWMHQVRHAMRPNSDSDPYERMKESARARNAALALAGRDIGEISTLSKRRHAIMKLRLLCTLGKVNCRMPLRLHRKQKAIRRSRTAISNLYATASVVRRQARDFGKSSSKNHDARRLGRAAQGIGKTRISNSNEKVLGQPSARDRRCSSYRRLLQQRVPPFSREACFYR